MPELNPQVVPERFVRRPFYVDAVRVTSENMEAVAKWCNGDVRTSSKPDRDLQTAMDPTTPKDTVPEKYIKVRVVRPANDRQSMAFVGDWILYAGTGYKVYTSRAFEKSFDPVSGAPHSLESARDARTGEFVSAAYAEENPNTTVVETHRDVTGGLGSFVGEEDDTEERHSHVVSKKRSDGAEEIGISGEHTE